MTREHERELRRLARPVRRTNAWLILLGSFLATFALTCVVVGVVLAWLGGYW